MGGGSCYCKPNRNLPENETLKVKELEIVSLFVYSFPITIFLSFIPVLAQIIKIKNILTHSDIH
jgi:hypothetical protein